MCVSIPIAVTRFITKSEHPDVCLTACLQALLVSPPSDPDASTRLDLTHLTVFTIDDASTKDVDDGVSVERDEDGQLLLWVHVADPTAWLQPGRGVGGLGAGSRVAHRGMANNRIDRLIRGCTTPLELGNADQLQP